ncbi:hypothetical protein CEXT_464061 [Caerostris extrusa]|uniref:Uncharacterized protein n=1 Tax=Caerostris extrusa TaxID=172846 RepID=A0AAV4XQW2_CAEEX|nr:hypothetical protein CEXT_464061 [Caerostris extrusa]
MPPSPLPPPGIPDSASTLPPLILQTFEKAGSSKGLLEAVCFLGLPVVTATGNRWFVPHEKRSCDIVERGLTGRGWGWGIKGNRRWNSHREGIDRDRLRSS